MPVGLLKDIAAICPKEASLLGLDVGKKTIGLALAHAGMGIATPLHTLSRTKFTKDVEALKKLIAEYDIGGFVVGIPVNMDGSEGPRAQSIRDFSIEFHKALGNDPWIALWDERLSTVSVEDFVGEFVEKKSTRRNAKASGLIDRLAAQIILQGALDYLARV
ncbi:MAG: Holliday junction resolvase RuvX [Alphaproteobacteria bacterium]|nr:Holliday junction resolvase RuvX [Alphaproteobacteria bacterium]MCD8519947.1 Holliday junction resolvase RuvX [Alphaproteobacteria bacterium]MCD8526413.1 Holliday junction resolvase RuvX [Alphaproteobacteria bacterium]MCD8571558.1 Holliday junction resolvase RuvX [Alphaproteobacteria bacterium]